jgi:SecD/SecF fusion protein
MFGGETLKDFAFAMLVGVASGTYSSIFIASPVLTAWKEREPSYRARRARIEQSMGHVPAFPEQNVIARLEEERVPAVARAARAPVEPAIEAPSEPSAAGVAEPGAPTGEIAGDGAQTQPPPLVGTDPGGQAQPRQSRRSNRRQQRRRRKHGRNR